MDELRALLVSRCSSRQAATVTKASADFDRSPIRSSLAKATPPIEEPATPLLAWTGGETRTSDHHPRRSANRLRSAGVVFPPKQARTRRFQAPGLCLSGTAPTCGRSNRPKSRGLRPSRRLPTSESHQAAVTEPRRCHRGAGACHANTGLNERIEQTNHKLIT